ncbi:hypothetical protein [Streptomyces sp. NPDC000888]
MATAATHQPVHLDALGPRGPYRTRQPSTVRDVTGAEVARLSLVPPVYVTRALSALRKAEPVQPARVDALLEAAAEQFAYGTVGGLDVRTYEHLVSRTAGTPLQVVRAATRNTARFVALARSSAEQGRPRGTLAGRAGAGAGHAVWAGFVGETWALAAITGSRHGW